MQMNSTKSTNSMDVPIYNLFGLVERYLDLDQTDGPHRYYGWDDLVETIPRTVFNKVKIGSNNKNPKIIVLSVEFLIWCCSNTHSVDLINTNTRSPVAGILDRNVS